MECMGPVAPPQNSKSWLNSIFTRQRHSLLLFCTVPSLVGFHLKPSGPTASAWDGTKKHFHRFAFYLPVPSKPYGPSNPETQTSPRKAPKLLCLPPNNENFQVPLSLAYFFWNKTWQLTYRLCVKYYNSHQLIFPLHIPSGSERSKVNHTQEVEL